MASFILFASILLLLYTYIGYPLILVLTSFFINRPINKKLSFPKVSLIIAAYNEENHIAAKIENSLALDYPTDLLEIIVVSDGSTDKTDAIVKSFSDKGIKLLRVEGRLGKTAAQNRAAANACGEILIFSDATTVYEKDVVLKMLPSFADPEVGCVSGKLKFRQRDDVNFGGEKNTSEKYDQYIKQLESQMFSIYGVNGCLYAVRKELYEPIPDFLTSDFVLPLIILGRGKRVIFEPTAVCYEEPCRDAKGEFNRKIRTARAGIVGIVNLRYLLNPFKYLWASVGLINHKIIRWLSPFLLITALVSNIVCLLDGPLYVVLFSLQFFFYLCALVGYYNEKMQKKFKIFTIPFNFLLINLAAFLGFIEFLKGNISEAWETNRE